MLSLIFFLFINVCSAFHVTSGFYMPLLDVQDKNGKEVKNHIDPTIGIGRNWQIGNDWGFSPQFNYIYDLKGSDDGYNDYKVHTFVILYDFVWLPIDSMKSGNVFALRFGIGNFIKRISGEGGAITVPNGSSGSSTAYRPEKTITSFSGTFNLGADLSLDLLKDYFNNFGFRLEAYTFRPLSQEYRNYSYSLTAVGYF